MAIMTDHQPKPDEMKGAENVPLGRVNRFLKEMGWNQVMLAKKIRLNPGQLSRVLNGKEPGPSVWIKIAKIMNIPVKDLTSGVRSPKEVHERYLEDIRHEKEFKKIGIKLNDYRIIIQFAYSSTLPDAIRKTLKSYQTNKGIQADVFVRLLESALFEYEQLREVVRRIIPEDPGFREAEFVRDFSIILKTQMGDQNPDISVADMSKWAGHINKIKDVPALAEDIKEHAPYGGLMEMEVIDIFTCAQELIRRRIVHSSDSDFMKLVDLYVAEQERRTKAKIKRLKSNNFEELMEFFETKLGLP